jgi:hypothetical protein
MTTRPTSAADQTASSSSVPTFARPFNDTIAPTATTASATLPSGAPSHTVRALSVAWPDTHPDTVSPSHSDRRADLLAQFSLTSVHTSTTQMQQSHSNAADAQHTLQPLRAVLPMPSSSSASAASSSGNSPSLSAQGAIRQLHSSTSSLLNTFNQSSGALTPAKAKLNQFILDLVRNQIQITGQSSADTVHCDDCTRF